MSARLPDFLIVGAMRSGTSALAKLLRKHPDVFMPDTKELHYFDREFTRGLDWYARHFSAARPGQLVGEATPSYAYDVPSAERIAEAVPAARLVMLLRNPSERAYSHYWHERVRGDETRSFADALAAEDERIRGGGLADRLAYSYVDRGRYAPQLERLDRLGLRVEIVLFDDFQRDPGAAFHGVTDYLGLARVDAPTLGARYNQFTVERSRHLAQVARSVPLLRRTISRLNRRPGSYPPMAPEPREWLDEQFKADNRALQSRLGRSLPAGWAR